MELQKLWVSLQLKADDFGQGLDEARRRAEGFAGSVRSGIGGALGTLQSVGTVAFLGVGAAAVGGFGLAMNAAIDMNASLEQSTMQFTTLMGDADKAKAHVANLFEFGAKTPFETEPIIQASKHLQVFGGEALNTMDNLTLVGDAAAAVGQPIDEVSFWVGRMYAALQAGQPFGEASARLQEMGLMAPQTRTQLEEMQKAGVSGTEIFGAFQAQLGNFTGAMEMQSGSWSGMMSTLTDTLMMAAANGLKPFFDLAREGLGSLLEWLNSPAVQNGIVAIAEGLRTAGDVVKSFVGNLQEGMSPIDAFIEAIWDIAPQSVLDALVNFRDNILPGLMTAFHNIVDPIVSWVQNNVQLRDVLAALGIAIASVVIPAVVSLVLSMAPIFLTVGALIAVVALLRNAWENNWGGIQEKVQAVIAWLVPFVQNAIAAIRQWWEENGAAILAGVRSVWESVKQIIELAINLIKIIVGAALSVLKALWDRFGDEIVAAIRFAWNTVSTIIGTAIENIKLIISAFIDLFTGDWEGFKDKIGQIWQNSWDAVVEILGNLWGLLQPKLLEIWDNIKGWFDDKIEDFKQLGRDVIDGIINGLDEVGDKIRQTLVDWATRAWDSVKEFFGISSPATKGKDAGKNIGEGLIEGVLESGDDFWSRTEVVFDTYYADIEKWYTSRPWEEMPEYTITVWDETLTQLWPVTGLRFEEFHDSIIEWWVTRPWESLPEFTIGIFNAKFATMGERLAPTFEDFFQTSILVFREQDWAIIGSQIVDGVVHGVNSNAGKLEEAMRAIARRAKEAANKELEMASPAKAMIPTGEGIVNGIIAGVLNRREALRYGLETIVSDVEDILSQAGDAGGIAGGFAKRFTDTVITPMEARLESLGGRVEAVQDLFKERMGSELITDVSHYGDTLRQLLMLKNTLVYNDGADATQVAMVQDAIEALRERGRLNQEYIQQQERLLALEKARADVDFLKSQLELLKLVQENGMDASVLAGLEFGLDADAGALMDTMVDVMRRLVQSAEDELGIHSPSTWARDTMRNVMQTMAATAEQERVELRDSLGRALQPALSTVGADVGGRTTDNSRRTAVYGGYHVTVQSGRDSWLEEQDELMR